MPKHVKSNHSAVKTKQCCIVKQIVYGPTTSLHTTTGGHKTHKKAVKPTVDDMRHETDDETRLPNSFKHSIETNTPIAQIRGTCQYKDEIFETTLKLQF